MNRKLMAKILIDICLTVSLLLLMPYSLIGETAHEWIGMAMLVLFIVHHILNRKWIGALAKGRYTIFRIYQTLLVIAMLILMLGSMISGILLSNHIFKAVTIAGTTIAARTGAYVLRILGICRNVTSSWTALEYGCWYGVWIVQGQICI